MREPRDIESSQIDVLRSCCEASTGETSLADPNTRQGKRTPVTLKIKFKSETLEQFIERYAVDVSQGGIFIRTKEPLAVGTQMRFEFQLRDASPLIGGEGTVVWTRENDPSRPAIAPGMGVRFDRLADGSQSVLERILAEKAKQAPQRGPTDTTKPPMFTDTPTRVAPAPVQDALLGQDSRRAKAELSEQHTPLPQPMPFHSDADEFPDEAFEEATKVRALDELIAQTAGAEVGTATEPDLFGKRGALGLDELAARRGPPGRADSTLADPPAATPEPAAEVPETLDPSATSPGFASGRTSESTLPVDRESAPGLPSPPEASISSKTAAPRLLDTTPSPRTDSDPMEGFAKTRLGLDPVPVATRPQRSTPSPIPVAPVKDALNRSSGMQAVAQESTASVRMPAKKSSAVPIIILLLVLIAAGGAGVWFFVLREKAVEQNANQTASGSNKPASGSNQGSDTVATGSDGSGSAGSAAVGSNAVEPPKAPLVEIEITSAVDKATVEIVGTEHSGPAPLKAKLEQDKAYTVRVSAPGFATFEEEVKGGLDKLAAKLDPKPRMITITSQPNGALIMIDGAPIGHSTPYDVELTKAQAAKKSVRVGLRRGGYRPLEKVVDAAAYTEDPAKLIAKVEVKLVAAPVVVRPPAGSGSGSAGSAGSASGSGSGSATPTPTPTPPGGEGSDAAPPPPPPPPTGAGASEPVPDFVKP
jgi:uncharacterized protein (TIGR02266 family)